MNKIFINIVSLLLLFLVPNFVFAISTDQATEQIDINKNCTLTLNYNYKDYEIKNINIKIYNIAIMNANFQYELSSDFNKYLIKVNGLKTQEEWETLKKTIDSYIEADNIKTFGSYSITNHKITLSNLKPGLYYITTDSIETDKYSFIFDSILINLPDLTEEGSWNYDINAYPKVEQYTPKYEKINYRVIKEWVDNKEERPKSIEIEIYKNQTFIEKQILSSKNNWSYTWEADDDGSKWIVVERNLPQNYTVSITEKEHTFIVVNTNSISEVPKTLDNINLYFYLLLASILGLILLTLYFVVKKRNVQ